MPSQRSSKFQEIGSRYGFQAATADGKLAPYAPSLSENSPFLGRDTKVFELTASEKHKENKQQNALLGQVMSRRAHLRREHMRRKAERETVENYVQTPYAKSKGLSYGSNVVNGRMEKIHAGYQRAEKIGAMEGLSRLERLMRFHQIKICDLFDHVDTDGNGCVDREELKVVLKQVGMPNMNPAEFERLFNYLDDSGDGIIRLDELESAVREFRQFKWQGKAAEKHIKTLGEMKQAGAAPDLKKYTHGDTRGHAGMGAVLGEGFRKMDEVGSTTIPLLGQQLMTMQLDRSEEVRAKWEDEQKHPLSVFEIQAAKAMNDVSRQENQLKGQAYDAKKRRRDEIRAKLHEKRNARVALEKSLWKNKTNGTVIPGKLATTHAN